MDTFEFVKEGGGTGRIDASSPEEAIKLAQGIVSTSGVRKVSTMQGKRPPVNTVNASQVGTAENFNVPTQADRSKVIKADAQIQTTQDQPQVEVSGEDIWKQIMEASGIDSEMSSKVNEVLNQTTGGKYLGVMEDIVNKAMQTRFDQAQYQKDAAKMQGEAGLPELESELAGFQSEFNTITAARDSRQVNEVGKATGVSSRALAARSDEIQKQYGLQVADNRINQLATAGKINAATQLIEAKLDLKYGDLEAEMSLYRDILDMIEPVANAEQTKLAEQRRFMLDQAEGQINAARASEKELSLVKAEAFKNWKAMGGSASDYAKIEDAQSTGEVAATGFMTSREEQLGVQLQQAQLGQIGLENKLTQTQIDQLTNQLSFTSTGIDPATESIIASSSQYGDQRLTDSQLEKIQQSTNALGSLESLQTLLGQGEDGISLTGPITGRVRTLILQLGGDADAAAIKATIQGLVPTVARGIFGEVGVLTDTDIENYKKTLPNLNSTDEQNRLVTLIMYDVLSRSLKNTLVTNAQNQVNVSGFLPTYQDVMTRIETGKSQLGITSFTNLGDDELINSVPTEDTQDFGFTPSNFNSFMANFGF